MLHMFNWTLIRSEISIKSRMCRISKYPSKNIIVKCLKYSRIGERRILQYYSKPGSSKRTALENIAIYLQQLPLQISCIRSRYLLCLQCLEHCVRKSGKSKPAITLKTQTFLKHMGIFLGPKNFCFLWEVGGGFCEWQVHWPTGEESLQN